MNFGLLILHFLNTQIKNTLERERFEVNCVRNSAMRSSESQIRYFTCATRSVMIIQVYRVSEKNIYLLRHWWTIARNLGKKTGRPSEFINSDSMGSIPFRSKIV